MERSPNEESKRLATALFAAFLSSSHADGEAEFAGLYGAHAPQADELRRLYAEHRKFQHELAVFSKVRGDKQPSAYKEGARVGDRIGEFRLLSRIASGVRGSVGALPRLRLVRRWRCA